MIEWLDSFIYHTVFYVPTFLIQEGEKIPFEPWTNPAEQQQHLATTLIMLGVLSVIILIILAINFQYLRWRRHSEFVSEIRSLKLDSDTESALSKVVKRFSLDDPKEVLASCELFDEMAVEEMKRILSTPGTVQSKTETIDALYKIRAKAYQSNRIDSEVINEEIERKEFNEKWQEPK